MALSSTRKNSRLNSASAVVREGDLLCPGLLGARPRHRRSRKSEDESSESDRERSGHRSKKRRPEEVAEPQFSALESEVEKRRKRIEAWRQMKAAEAEKKSQPPPADGSLNVQTNGAEAAPSAEGEAPPPAEHRWNLDDDSASSGDEGDAMQVSVPDLQRPAHLPALRRADEDEEGLRVTEARLGGAPHEPGPAPAASAAVQEEEEEEVDPLDAFMAGDMFQETALAPKSEDAGPPEEGAQPGAVADDDDEAWMRRLQQGRLSKGDRLVAVDHSTIDYPPFRRNFYREPESLARLSEGEVAALRLELDGVQVRGKAVPRPLTNWHQAGLSGRVHEALRREGFETPLPIQAQALPAIMSGRDTIGIAKTGSGKTLAFVLPLLRHVKDQRPVESGEGPVALAVAPTRELVTQIAREIARLGRGIGVRCVAVYGGSGVANQISELKRGAEAVVCTPGRMIDILVMSGGKITNLRRVTFLILDEADRMFDMGFEPQIMRIVNNVRPDRQTVMFSATFPRAVEALARNLLVDPVEIQERCDNLFRDLLRHGYPCLSLHGGKDQSDRESTIADFKSDVCNVLVATSVAARGLDVKDLVLVVNYDAPNHLEDYVHREEAHAPDIVRALRESGAAVPEDLRALAEGFEAKRRAGAARAHGSGYGGSGYKFNNAEDNLVKALRRATAREYGLVDDDGAEEEAEGGGAGAAAKTDADDGIREVVRGAELATTAEKEAEIAALPPEQQALAREAQRKARETLERLVAASNVAASRSTRPPGSRPPGSRPPAQPAPADVASLLRVMQPQAGAAAAPGAAAPRPAGPARHFETELEINDFPQRARWRVTHRDTINDIGEIGAAVVIKGTYYPPGAKVAEGDRKIYLHIQGPTEQIVRAAKNEIKRIVEEETERAMRRDAPSQGRYSIM
ncbi:hypothetical protein QBZ16_003822 [Prototheca wickerhamii]|uniref:RNA helicase n=1 Tax=Prototheca wickerhamii TaxID=3111 RepID=A0AAD9MH42_PROWI|nr:hypothetical protein QBZ16_003822 [Prototheca wickerhamii]